MLSQKFWKPQNVYISVTLQAVWIYHNLRVYILSILGLGIECCKYTFHYKTAVDAGRMANPDIFQL
jgi:hypothetical protein